MEPTRREVLKAPAALGWRKEAVGREARVRRHEPRLRALDAMAPLSVGNGEFAFTADVTGLQSFPESYQKGIPPCTQAQWGWHAAPLAAGLKVEDYRMTEFDTHGRKVGYPMQTGPREVVNWLRENPHRLNLGRVGFRMKDAGRAEELRGIEQRLELYHPPRETWNPTYEIEYWRWGLKTAQRWRELLGLGRHAKWDDVIAKLPKLPVKDGVYLAHENCPRTFAERNRDHPSILAALGVLPGEGVDRETMRRTLKRVMAEWRWSDTWGWDYPMTAMTAARLGEGETAVDALLLDTPKNRYLVNGHNYQRPGLHLYLPGNGGLLTAVGMMAAGWEGSGGGCAGVSAHGMEGAVGGDAEDDVRTGARRWRSGTGA